MDILKLYQDFNVQYKTSGHKHCREGWVQVACPFCVGNPGYHLGFHLENEYYVCYRCGGERVGYDSKDIPNVLSHLLNVPKNQVYGIMQQYGGTSYKPIKPKGSLKAFKYPSNVIELQTAHKKYLEKRKFDPEFLAKTYDLKATGLVSKLDGLNFSKRILVPIYWEGKVVSFLARNLSSKKDSQRYMVCPAEREILNNRKTLYTMPGKLSNVGLGVEGVTDVWRMGKGSVGLYGIKYSTTQMRLIKNMFTRFHILFDDDPQAQQQALKLKADLEIIGGLEVINHTIKGDPGDMSQDDAAHFMKSIGL